MRSLFSISLLAASALAVPSQLTFNEPLSFPNDAPSTFYKSLKPDLAGFDIVTLPELPHHKLRIKSSKLCDPTVKQYSGYLDISDSKHLFFWFFESRSKPSKDPLTLWLNGGPGCSSSTGLLFELGPCSIVDEGRGTKPNNYSWNSHSNVIFLDQPVQVGFSWSDGSPPNNTPDAAKDVYAFLQLFYHKYSQYADLPFHIAAESYGGTYAPNMASVIHHQNKELKSIKALDTFTALVHIPLTSVLIGNGLTEPYTQFASIPEYACAPSKYAFFSESTCTSLKAKAGTCQNLVKYCYNSPSRFTCVPATLYCWSNMVGPIQQMPINPYDIRKKCNRNENPLCYEEMKYIETYMNQPAVKKELGAADQVKFESCNMAINQAFQFSGDGMHNSAALIPELLQDGIRFLIYAGEYDFMCNWLGNKEWFLGLETHLQAEILAGRDVPFKLDNGEKVGEIRNAGHGAGNFTFVKIYNAGHMVPFDQPEAALKMYDSWISNVNLSA